jgi:hypothetical protein
MPLVFQYGSNADTTEINSANRLAGRAVDRGRAQTVDEFEIAFRGGTCPLLLGRNLKTETPGES